MRGGERWTLLVVADERSPVRRFQVPARWLRRGPWVAAIVALALAAVSVDWVRLRLEAVDVARLRAQAVRQDEALAAVEEELAAFEAEMERIAEFERRVRVIADLPRRLVETEVPDVAAGSGTAAPDPAEAAAPGDAPAAGALPPADAPQPAVGTGGQGGGGPDLPSAASLDPAPDALERLRTRALALAGAVAPRASGLDDLARQLERERARLASLPTVWPAEGWVTSGFGHRTSPFTGRRQFHAGLDIAADFGTAIVAPARGRVAFVGRKGALGRTVVLDHGHGLRTTFGHTSEIYVKRGQTVERGTRIAAVGSTGRSTGPHVHYGVSRDGRSLDPRDFVVE